MCLDGKNRELLGKVLELHSPNKAKAGEKTSIPALLYHLTHFHLVPIGDEAQVTAFLPSSSLQHLANPF